MPGCTQRAGITEPAATHSACCQEGWAASLSGKRGQPACMAEISTHVAGTCSNEHVAAVQHLLPEAEHQ